MTVWESPDKTEKIDALCRLVPKRCFGIKKLEFLCREYDNTFSTAELECGPLPDRHFRSFFLYYIRERLAGELYIFIDENNNAQITALVDPVWRRRGIFKQLLKAARSELKKYRIKTVYIVCEPDCRSAADVCTHMGLKYAYSDHFMSIIASEASAVLQKTDISEVELSSVAAEGSKEEPAVILRSGDGKDIAVAHALLTDDKCACIYGVEVNEEYRRRGFGRLVVLKLLEVLCEKDSDIIAKLHVSSDNIPAMSLYQSLGFRSENQLDYYLL